MSMLKAFKALGPIDVRSVSRDSLLRWMAILPLVIALAARLAIPPALFNLEELLSFELMTYYPAFMGYVLLTIAPNLCGMVIGFLLLDQRDDHTLTALQVTPLPMNSYLVYRLGMPMLISLLVTLLAFPIAGLSENGLLTLLAASIAAAPLAPMMALILGAFAANKVQGFALTKASGVFFIAPVIAYFAPGNWQWAFGVVPTFWPAKLFWMLQAGESGGWIVFLIGLIYQALLLALLLRRFNTVTHR
ncbi:MAG: hypothetical protein MI924_18650 [Chloroflexales bacterium]|nr:hypothetical protein [Chloroflexales bacterium]